MPFSFLSVPPSFTHFYSFFHVFLVGPVIGESNVSKSSECCVLPTCVCGPSPPSSLNKKGDLTAAIILYHIQTHFRHDSYRGQGLTIISQPPSPCQHHPHTKRHIQKTSHTAPCTYIYTHTQTTLLPAFSIISLSISSHHRHTHHMIILTNHWHTPTDTHTHTHTHPPTQPTPQYMPDPPSNNHASPVHPLPPPPPLPHPHLR